MQSKGFQIFLHTTIYHSNAISDNSELLLVGEKDLEITSLPWLHASCSGLHPALS